MPSLYPDPATLPPLPMTAMGITAPLDRSVKILHKDPPEIFTKLMEIVERLVNLGSEVSAKQESKEIVQKLTHMGEVIDAHHTFEGIVDLQLIRHHRDVAIVRQNYGFLTTWLCLIDRWIVNCEHFARTTQPRYRTHVERFEIIHKDLSALVAENTDNKAYRFADLLQLFETLGISNCDEQLR
ncbi:hypothetical protein GGR57DRAFT_272588 [Xylariaceae sp. FL1272]|nr:hypothetical protein GGR57DRAFT_272588 [Xylariaceae sp. FL1272]